MVPAGRPQTRTGDEVVVQGVQYRTFVVVGADVQGRTRPPSSYRSSRTAAAPGVPFAATAARAASNRSTAIQSGTRFITVHDHRVLSRAPVKTSMSSDHHNASSGITP